MLYDEHKEVIWGNLMIFMRRLYWNWGGYMGMRRFPVSVRRLYSDMRRLYWDITRKISNKKKLFFLRGDFRPFPNKNVPIWDHFFPLLFPKDSESLKILDIRLWEVGAKRPLNGTSKVYTHTDGQTDRQTDISTYRKHRPRGPMLWKYPWFFSSIRFKCHLQSKSGISDEGGVCFWKK